MKKLRITICVLTVLLLAAGCGWDSTPQYVIATPKPDYTPFARWTPSPVPEDAEVTATPEPTDQPEGSASAQDPSGSPDGTAGATPGATKDPNATDNPLASPTPDPYLFGRWEFKRSRYKGKEVAASETKQKMTVWLFSNFSAEMNIYEIGKGDPPENTQGVQWRIDGNKLTLTLYGETIMTLIYDGTYLTLRQEVNDSTDDMIFEKTGE